MEELEGIGSGVRLIHGSAHFMPEIKSKSVHTIITSPPYYGLRAYDGDQDVEWPTVAFRANEWAEQTVIVGCDPDCRHEWVENTAIRHRGQVEQTFSGSTSRSVAVAQNKAHGLTCSICGGERVPLGLEESPIAYVGHLLLCLREWHRVLRDDGTLWVNLGDAYNTGTSAGRQESKEGAIGRWQREGIVGATGRNNVTGLKPKDMVGIPWLFAMAARADGWYLRSDIIWHKPNAMPSSVTDRPTTAHEYIFLLAKSSRYFFDADAVREPMSASTKERDRYGFTGAFKGQFAGSPIEERWQDGRPIDEGKFYKDKGRNMRSVWSVTTQSTPYAHFATFPERLVSPMIRASTSSEGCCPICGAQFGRVEEDTETWAKTCNCTFDSAIPCVVLDPFSGSGTTAQASVRLGRNAIGVDISKPYLTEVTQQRFAKGIQLSLV